MMLTIWPKPPFPTSSPTTFLYYILGFHQAAKNVVHSLGLLYSPHSSSLSVCIHVLVHQETTSDPTNSNSRLLRSSTLPWPSSSYLAYVISQQVITRLLRAGAVSSLLFFPLSNLVTFNDCFKKESLKLGIWTVLNSPLEALLLRSKSKLNIHTTWPVMKKELGLKCPRSRHRCQPHCVV